MTQLTKERVEYEVKTATIKAVAAAQQAESAAWEKLLNERIAQLRVSNDRVQHKLSKLQATIDSLSPEERAKRSQQFIEHTKRGADLAERCSEELQRKERALKTCVGQYQGVSSVNHPTK